jgi:hypothetical protein
MMFQYAFQIGDKITLESGPFAAGGYCAKKSKNTHYVLVLESMAAP